MNRITLERQQNSRDAATRAVEYYAKQTYLDETLQAKNPSNNEATPENLQAQTSSEESDSLAEVYGQYSPEYQECIDRTNRIRDYINIFAGKVLPPEAIDAGVLYEVKSGELTSRQGMTTAATSLMEYYTSPGTHKDSANYVAALLNDMDYMNGYAKWYKENESYINLIESEDSVWSQMLPPIDIDTMGIVGKEVNVESILVKSCTKLDSLMVSANEIMQFGDTYTLDGELLDDIIEAETFYGPLCEVFGFDGLAMELRSQSRKLRLLKEGKKENIMHLQEYCNSMHQAGPGAVLKNIVGDDNFAISSAVNPPDYLAHSQVPYASVQLGEFAIDLGNGKLAAGNWRLKSVGSLADKIFNSGKERLEVPMDVMGLTMILHDEAELAEVFADVIQRVYASNELEGRPAPSKTKWAFVQGDDAFRQMVRSRLDSDFIDENVQILEENKGYRVAKFTCLAEGGQMPVEVQFLTKADRKNARTGPDAHIIYKAQMDGVFYSAEQRMHAARTLGELHCRKVHMQNSVGTLEANPESLVRGERDMTMAYLNSV